MELHRGPAELLASLMDLVLAFVHILVHKTRIARALEIHRASADLVAFLLVLVLA